VVITGVFGIGPTSKLLLDMSRHTISTLPSQYALSYSPVSFKSLDGLQLEGWWLKNSDDSPVIIMVHGFMSNRAEPANRTFGIAKSLMEKGYNVLMFDLRAQGQSEGSLISGGYYETNDLLGAVSFVRDQGITSKIGVLGFSMGAATSLMTAAESADIAAVVADSSFSDASSVLDAQLEQRNIPNFLVPGIEIVAKVAFGLDINKISPVDALADITVPVFIIHGGQDEVIPVDEAYVLHEVVKNPGSQFWIVPEAGHTEAYTDRPQEYMDRLLAFLGTNLSGQTLPA
jgi:pimeloyl-ACP methyl ester carboxylesterase